MNFKGKGMEIQETVISIYRDFHRHPELSGEEIRTSQVIQKYLKEWGIEYSAGYAKTGILGVINSKAKGPTVALRADIDGLPIFEKNTHNYISKTPGKMHACGHDAHTAMLLGTAKLLKAMEKDLPGKVLLVFQPAEENGPIGGAKPMMDDGVFAKYQPDAIFAQHVWPALPVGKVGVMSGPMMGNSDKFILRIEGKGGHASMPHQTIDAIVIANKVIDALQTIISRNVDPTESAVITVGKISGGYRYNVVAEQVDVEGTIRTLNQEVKQLVKQRFFEVVEHVTAAMGGEVTIEYIDGYPATTNTEEEALMVQSAAQLLLGDEATPVVKPSLGSEDFSRFLEKYRGAFYWLGIKPRDLSQIIPLHDSKFVVEEESLLIGTELMAQVAFNYLKQNVVPKKETKKEVAHGKGRVEGRGSSNLRAVN